MEKESQLYQTYLQILNRELVPAMGCTEPIALAYCAAKARAVLEAIPERVEIEVSGNIIKNVKSVIVPNTNGQKGIAAAAAIGILAGKEDLELEVLSKVSQSQKDAILPFIEKTQIHVEPSKSGLLFDIVVRLFKGSHSSMVRIAQNHTNIVRIEKDGQILFEKSLDVQSDDDKPDYDTLTIEKIYDFANTVCIEDVEGVLQRQIDFNTAISQEGLKGNYGACIGQVLLKSGPQDLRTRAKAAAAAGSDARMSGCELPVVINSGSGNQGMTVSLPVIEYAKELGVSKEKLYRALIISNLSAVHQKAKIGTLSAYCGAVSAGAAAGAGIAYLLGSDYKDITHTLVNALAITSGIICDGAKPSCAAKIASAVDAGILGYDMYKNGQQFYGGDGVISLGVENTINNIGILGKDGMAETDKTILSIMTGCNEQ
jgi:L-cysteine desulfidase